MQDVPVEKIEENYPENERYQKFYALYQWKSNKENDGGRTSNMDLLQDLMKAAKEGVDIDFEEVQNVFDEL
jgi:acyl-CoA-binding protein